MKLTETQEVTMQMAKAGYEGYAAYTGNKSVITGDTLPTWQQLPPGAVNAWFAAADNMIKFLAALPPVEVVDGE